MSDTGNIRSELRTMLDAVELFQSIPLEGAELEAFLYAMAAVDRLDAAVDEFRDALLAVSAVMNREAEEIPNG